VVIRSRSALALALALAASAVLLVSSALVPSGVRSDAGTRDLAALLARFRSLPGLEATFHEEKSVALLRDPLVSDGRVYFQPPDKLARHVTSPVASSMVLDGDELRFGDATTSERLDLRAHPEARVFVDAFRAVLAGDADAIARRFDARFESTPGGTWHLALAPRDPAVRRVLRGVRMSGSDVRLSTLEVEEASGDLARTSFTRVDTARTFSRVELRRIFRVGGM
jgi:hypothetical protein